MQSKPYFCVTMSTLTRFSSLLDRVWIEVTIGAFGVSTVPDAADSSGEAIGAEPPALRKTGERPPSSPVLFQGWAPGRLCSRLCRQQRPLHRLRSPRALGTAVLEGPETAAWSGHGEYPTPANLPSGRPQDQLRSAARPRTGSG